MIGARHHRLQFQAKTQANDGRGGRTNSWATVFTRWGQLTAQTGRENETGGRLEAGVTHFAMVAHDSETRTLNAEHRIAWVDGAVTRVFEIVSVADPNGRRRDLQIECRLGGDA